MDILSLIFGWFIFFIILFLSTTLYFGMISIVFFFILIMIFLIIFGSSNSKQIENFPIEVEVESSCNNKYKCPSCIEPNWGWDFGNCYICNGGIYNRRW